MKYKICAVDWVRGTKLLGKSFNTKIGSKNGNGGVPPSDLEQLIAPYQKMYADKRLKLRAPRFERWFDGKSLLPTSLHFTSTKTFADDLALADPESWSMVVIIFDTDRMPLLVLGETEEYQEMIAARRRTQLKTAMKRKGGAPQKLLPPPEPSNTEHATAEPEASLHPAALTREIKPLPARKTLAQSRNSPSTEPPLASANKRPRKRR